MSAAATAAAARRAITIDIVSDAICPWCLVGKRRLAAALKTLPNVKATIRWRPFFLDPTLPLNGVDKMSHYISKFGKARIDSILPQMAAVGASLIPPVTFDYGGRIYPTSAAHVAIEAAWEAGGALLQDAVVEALFSHYFEQKGDLTKEEVIRIALKAGLSNANAAVSAPGAIAGVESEVKKWRNQYGISGVPFFIIKGLDSGKEETISGAEDARVIAEAINKVIRV